MRIIERCITLASERDYLCKTGITGNPLILWGVLVELLIIFAIDYTPWGNALFGTAPLPPAIWLIAGFFSALMWSLEEMRKLVVRRDEYRLTT